MCICVCIFSDIYSHTQKICAKNESVFCKKERENSDTCLHIKSHVKHIFKKERERENTARFTRVKT